MKTNRIDRILEKEWQKHTYASSAFQLAHSISGLVKDARARKELAVKFIRMKEQGRRSSYEFAKACSSNELVDSALSFKSRVESELESAAFLLSISLAKKLLGMSYCIRA